MAQGIGSMAGAAALVDPEPISKAILTGVAVVSGAVGLLFGDRAPASDRPGPQIQPVHGSGVGQRQHDGGTYSSLAVPTNQRLWRESESCSLKKGELPRCIATATASAIAA
jgi:hypothetical protein